MLLSLSIWIPIIGGLAVLTTGRDKNANLTRWLALVAAVAGFLVTIPLYTGFDPSTAALQFVENVPWIDRYKIRYYLGVDGISMWFVLLNSFTTILVVIAGWVVIEKQPAQYFAAFLIMSGLINGSFAAADAVLFYVFFEAMLIPMYLIIGIWGGPNRLYAAIKFFLYTLLGSLLMLVALLYLYNCLCKWPLAAWRDGSYMFDLLRNANFAQAPFPRVLGSRAVGKALTWGALVAELVLGPLLLVPETAGIACVAAIAFHLSIARLLDVHLFSQVMVAALLACLPRALLEGLGGTGPLPLLATPAFTVGHAAALLAIAVYVVVAIAWDPPTPGWCSAQVRRVFGPLLDAIHWVRSWRLFVDSSASHIEIEITAVMPDGSSRRWTWDRVEGLAPGGAGSPPRRPGHRFQRFRFAVVTRPEACTQMVARLRETLAAAGVSPRALSVDALYVDVHTRQVLGGKTLHTEVASSRTAGFDYEACARLVREVRCPPTRKQLLELLLLAGLDAALRDRPRVGLVGGLATVTSAAGDLHPHEQALGPLDSANAARLREHGRRIGDPVERAMLLGALDRLSGAAHA